MYTDAYACSNLPQMPDRASTVALWTEPIFTQTFNSSTEIAGT